MKNYNVTWEERLSVNVEAESEKEACDKILNCDYDENGVAYEISNSPEAFEIEIP